jgi:hypothetical protein
MLNVKSKRAVLGIAACAAVVALTFAGMAVTTTSGAGTDTAPAPTLTAVATAAATPAASTPPQSPVEPPTGAAGNANAGNQAGANTLPSAGYGNQDGNGRGLLFLVLAGSILAAGTALTIAGRLPNSRKQ